jgi:hypothetical protein
MIPQFKWCFELVIFTSAASHVPQGCIAGTPLVRHIGIAHERQKR